jgi:hypothetical protein
MSEHREHLLPDTEDVPCRGAAIVEPNIGMRQRIYRRARSIRAHPPVKSGCRRARSRRHVLPGSCLRLRDVTRRWGR